MLSDPERGGGMEVSRAAMSALGGAGFAVYAGAALALALIVIATAFGIGRIGGKALESLSKAPESRNDVRMLMILAAALIEGIAFFAAIILLLIVLMK
jgi:F-type H+-transporting ATPase subunit c